MLAARDLPALREKHLSRALPRFWRYLKRCLVHEQQDRVRLYAYTDDPPHTLRILLPHRQRPGRVREVVFRHEQWAAVQHTLEAQGFQLEVSAQSLVIQVAKDDTPVSDA